MTGLEMGLLAYRLRRKGFAPRIFRYRSAAASLSQHADRLADWVRGRNPEVVHFVAHSLGGLVVARCLAMHGDLPLGRCIALGTPFNGSHVARVFARHVVTRRLLGCARMQPYLEHGLDAKDGAGHPGIIAGTFGFGIGMFMRDLGQPNDGTVAVAETRWPGGAAHTTCATSHFGLLLSATVAGQVVCYLNSGAFALQG